MIFTPGLLYRIDAAAGMIALAAMPHNYIFLGMSAPPTTIEPPNCPHLFLGP